MTKNLRQDIEKIVTEIAYGAGDFLGTGYGEDTDALLSLFQSQLRESLERLEDLALRLVKKDGFIVERELKILFKAHESAELKRLEGGKE